jgi:DNA-binding NarL/FixJ family response regulator
MLSASQKRADPIRVSIADADRMASGPISNRLRRRFDVIGYVTSKSDLFRIIKTNTPEVVLVGCDLEEGHLSGLLALPEIQSKYPEIRLVLLIHRSDRELVVQAFRAGAMGVFDRSASNFEDLCKCIICIQKGQIWANTQQIKFALEEVSQATRVSGSVPTQAPRVAPVVSNSKVTPSSRVCGPGGRNLLTKREEDLVRLVADGLGNREVARRLNLSEHTIKNYMFRIFDKLGISNRVELVLYALNNPKRSLLSISSKESQTGSAEPNRLSDTG